MSSPTVDRASRPKALVLLARGLAKRCPRCGQGHLWTRWFSLPDRCPRCGLPFDPSEGYFLGGMAINIGITEGLFGLLVVAMALLSRPDVPWGWVLAVGLSFNAIFPIVFYPYSKMIFLAIDLLLRPTADRTWRGSAEPP
jgi:uncharacterized protein (DUF983 family)